MVNSEQQPTRFLIFAVLVFLLAQLYITVVPFTARDIPVEADDAYTYIQKAEQMRTCFLQDCEALATLQAQITERSSLEQTSIQQDRQYHRLFVVYHPLHSALLVALTALGLSYEIAYVVLAIAGKAILCLGIIYWLHSLFGPRTTAIALILLAPVVYVGTGIHTIVPSTMALALAAWLWGLVAKRGPSAKTVMVILSISMMLLHQVGKLYAGVALGLYVLLYFSSLRDKREQFFVVAMGFIIGAALLLPFFITTPVMNFDPTQFYPYEWDLLSAILPAVQNPLQIISIWFRAFTFPIISITLLSIGVLASVKRKQRPALLMAILLLLLLGFSLIYVVPWFGALLFERAWVPLAMLLTGFVAQAINASLAAVPTILDRLLQRDLKGMVSRTNALALVTGLLVILASVTYPAFYGRHYRLTLDNQIDRQDFSLTPEQPEMLFTELIQPGEAVLYTHELPLYYYLGRGGLAYGAVFLPVVKGTEREAYWLEQQDLAYMAALSPVPEADGISLVETASIYSPDGQSLVGDSVQIHLANTPAEAHLLVTFVVDDAEVKSTVIIPAGFTGWYELSGQYNANKIMLATDALLRVTGLRMHTSEQTRWPWQHKVALEALLGDSVTVYDFRSASLLPDMNFDVEVLNDDGSLVLARLHKPQSTMIESLHSNNRAVK